MGDIGNGESKSLPQKGQVPQALWHPWRPSEAECVERDAGHSIPLPLLDSRWLERSLFLRKSRPRPTRRAKGQRGEHSRLIHPTHTLWRQKVWDSWWYGYRFLVVVLEGPGVVASTHFPWFCTKMLFRTKSCLLILTHGVCPAGEVYTGLPPGP